MALNANCLLHAPASKLRADPDLVAAAKEGLLARLAVAGDGALSIYRKVPPELKDEKDVLLAAVKAVGSERAARVLREAPPELRADTGLVRAVFGFDNTDRQAVLAKLTEGTNKSCNFLQHASDELRADPEVVAAAKAALIAELARHSARASFYSPYFAALPELKAEKEVLLAALKAADTEYEMAADVLDDAPAELQTDTDVVRVVFGCNNTSRQAVLAELAKRPWPRKGPGRRRFGGQCDIDGRFGLQHVSDELRADPEFMAKAELLTRLARAAGDQAPAIYRDAPPELKAEKDVLLAALKATAKGHYADLLVREVPPQLLADEQFWLEAAAQDANFLKHASDELRADPEFMKAGLLAVIAGAYDFQVYDIYRKVPPELKDEKEVLLAALKAAGPKHAAFVLGEVPPELLENRQFWLAVVALNASCLEHAPPELQTDTELVRTVYGVDNTDRQAVLAKLAEAPNLLQHVSDELRADPEVVAVATAGLKAALLVRLAGATLINALYIYREALPELKAEKDVLLAALKAAGVYAVSVLHAAPPELQVDAELVRVVLLDADPGREGLRVLMVGLDQAGKTVILYKLKLGEVVTTIPTIGFNEETIEYKDTSFTVHDLGGVDKFRPLWRHYCQYTDFLVFVVDSDDRDRIDEARYELHRVLSEDELCEADLLVYVNKQDILSAMSIEEVTDKLGLRSLRDRRWYIQATCATSGDGLTGWKQTAAAFERFPLLRQNYSGTNISCSVWWRTTLAPCNSRRTSCGQTQRSLQWRSRTCS